jgi:hypothetical protein
MKVRAVMVFRNVCRSTPSRQRKLPEAGRLGVNAAADEAWALIKCKNLALGEAPLGFGEADMATAVGLRREVQGDAGIAVANATFECDRRGRWGSEPLEVSHADALGEEPWRARFIESDEECVVFPALAHDHVGLVVRVRGDADAATLAEGVVV